MARKSKEWIRCAGITLQLIIYLSNAFVWAVSILAVVCGFVIGIANDTIRVNSLEDLGVTTPATILIIYGFLMIIVTTVGCFSSVTAGKILSVIYVVLIIGYLLFDYFGGYFVLFSDNALAKYYTNINTSLTNYGNKSDEGVGIFYISPEKFWNHLQTRGKCCGFVSPGDWKKTPFARATFNIPDSCCNDVYNYRYCGLLVLHHPDTEFHSVDQMVHSMGCNDIFPEPMRFPPEDSLSYVGRFVGCVICLCFVLTCVIFVLVTTKMFRKDQGIDNLDYVESPKEEENDNSGVVMNGSGEQNDPRKVHPESTTGEDLSDPNANKRLKFKESGPLFIRDPDRPQSANSGAESDSFINAQAGHPK